MYSIVCKCCGNEYSSRYSTTMFCSDKCRRKYNGKNRGHERICKHCNKIFYQYKKRLFCSVECRRNYEKENKKEYTYVPVEKQIKTCLKCNGEYKSNSTKSKYCSYECRYKHQVELKKKPPVNIKCKECGKWFNTTNHRRKYCSTDCSDKFEDRKKETLRRERIKENGRVDWDISLERLIKRDKSVCYLCKNKVNIQVDSNDDYYPSIDHVNPIAKGGTHTWDNVKLAHRICNSLKSDGIETESNKQLTLL